MRWACSRPRSSSKLRSGATRRVSSRASSARRNRAALARPSSDFPFSSSLPITVTRTRACARSADTSTAVTVPKPTGSTALRSAPGLERASDLLDPVGLEQVADLYIIEVLHPDAALEALTHFPDVLLEALERRQGPVVHLDAVADHAHPCRSGDHARAHEAAGDRAHLGDLEQLAHLRLAQHDVLLLQREQPFHRRLHLFYRLVDDAVGAALHLLALGPGARVRVRPDVEPDDDRVRGLGEQHVPIGDPADPPVDGHHLHLRRGQLGERVGERLRGAALVRLDDDTQRRGTALGALGHEILERLYATGAAAARPPPPPPP